MTETLAQEFSRLVREYREDADSAVGAEAWNLIADFAVENADAIEASLSASSPVAEPVGYAGTLGDMLGVPPTASVAASSVDAIDRDRAVKAAVEANAAYGQWMPERWLHLFLDAYEGKSR